MRELPTNAYAGKVSQEFAARLERLAPDETVRAIVLPSVVGVRGGNHDRTDDSHYAAARQATKSLLLRLFRAIDVLFTDTPGQRLTAQPNALGYVVVETSRLGVSKLAQLDDVRAVIEDQAIFPLHRPQDDQAGWSNPTTT